MSKVDDDFINFLIKPPEPTLRYDEIPVDPTKEYEVLFVDVLNPLKPELIKHIEEYVVFRAILKVGFEQLYLNLDLIYKLHFAKKTFNIAWERAPGYKTLYKDKKYDCLIRFKRMSQKRLVIIHRQFIEDVFDEID